MIVMINLHAAKVDQLLALCARAVEFRFGLFGTGGKMSPALNVQGIRLKTAFTTGFRQPDGIENPDWNIVFSCCLDNLLLATTWSGECRCAKPGRTKYRYQKK